MADGHNIGRVVALIAIAVVGFGVGWIVHGDRTMTRTTTRVVRVATSSDSFERGMNVGMALECRLAAKRLVPADEYQALIDSDAAGVRVKWCKYVNGR